MNTAEQLLQVFCDNFVAYYKSHVSHVNIEGRNFVSDHELLNGIYDDLQDQIDMIAELLRTLGEYMPDSLGSIIEHSHIDTDPVFGSADELLSVVLGDLEHLVMCYEQLEEVADTEGLDHIANYGQDRVLALSKFIWQLKSTLA